MMDNGLPESIQSIRNKCIPIYIIAACSHFKQECFPDYFEKYFSSSKEKKK